MENLAQLLARRLESCKDYSFRKDWNFDRQFMNVSPGSDNFKRFFGKLASRPTHLAAELLILAAEPFILGRVANLAGARRSFRRSAFVSENRRRP